MKKVMTIIAVTLFLVCTVTGGVFAAYPTGYTLEQTATGFAALSVLQSHSPTTSVRMGTVTTTDRAAIVFHGGVTL